MPMPMPLRYQRYVLYTYGYSVHVMWISATYKLERDVASVVVRRQQSPDSVRSVASAALYQNGNRYQG
ncbi:hypothetical protein U1Q18_049277 [Sarracenia purpurea var. burkii]